MNAAQKAAVQQASERIRASGHIVQLRRTAMLDGLVLCHAGEEYEIIQNKAGKLHFKLVTPWSYTARYLIGGAVFFLLANIYTEEIIVQPGLLVTGILGALADKRHRSKRKRTTEQVYAAMGKVFNKGVGAE